VKTNTKKRAAGCSPARLLQPLLEILLRASGAAANERRRDLRGACRAAHADISSRQLFRDHAHRFPSCRAPCRRRSSDGRPKRPSSDICLMSRTGWSLLVVAGCQPWRAGITSLLANLASRHDRFARSSMAADSHVARRGWRHHTSKPRAVLSRGGCRWRSGVHRLSHARRDRRPAPSPRSAGRTISFGLIGMPPWGSGLGIRREPMRDEALFQRRELGGGPASLNVSA